MSHIRRAPPFGQDCLKQAASAFEQTNKAVHVANDKKKLPEAFSSAVVSYRTNDQKQGNSRLHSLVTAMGQ
eukprot:2827018-Alexandrium_andersonii.AAC.1